jgi:hypothetical protein
MPVLAGAQGGSATSHGFPPPQRGSRREVGRLSFGAVEWVALFVWLLVLTLALPLGAGALLRPEFGLAAMLAPVGFVGTLLFIILGGQSWLLWVAAAAGVVGFFAVAVGAYAIVTGTSVRSSAWALHLEELTGGLAGALLFLLFYATAPTVAAALGATAS